MSWGYVFRGSISVQSGLNMKLMENRILFCIQIPWELLLEYLRGVCLMSCSEIKATVWVFLKMEKLGKPRLESKWFKCIREIVGQPACIISFLLAARIICSLYFNLVSLHLTSTLGIKNLSRSDEVLLHFSTLLVKFTDCKAVVVIQSSTF